MSNNTQYLSDILHEQVRIANAAYHNWVSSRGLYRPQRADLDTMLDYLNQFFNSIPYVDAESRKKWENQNEKLCALIRIEDAEHVIERRAEAVLEAQKALQDAQNARKKLGEGVYNGQS